MNAFASALGALHADPNLSIECIWSPAGTPSQQVAFRGIRAEGREPVFGLGGGGAMAPQQFLDVRAADLPAAPRRGDAVTIGGASFVVQAAAQDTEALSWRLTLSEAA